MAAVWDPHPEYEFTAFGTKFHLDLAHGLNFALPGLKVTHIWEDSIVAKHPGLRTEGCFYTGTVRDDPKSSVVVNLCHGMVCTLYSLTSYRSRLSANGIEFLIIDRF
ncbi:hypothetical protein AAG570_011860 [Ranatra chinensis]|uniref:Peptidase M12B propeptide domain-containing protein n=1 Tax=Ranatra chinensis TaxID=642074 RepID=A0ABD0YZG4_9HEMI